ncbi:MAG: DUF819 domain-containing protein [Saprospiraceae bacterium]|jgi:uncharacterized membrane protein
MSPVFTNDAVVFGILICTLALVFWTSSLDHPFWKKFYGIVPPLLLCYFLPALLHWPLGLISGEEYADGSKSQLYFVASNYLLPACLIMLCISIDFKGLISLGPKALVMFLAGTLGVILGGPIALLLVTNLAPNLIPTSPELLWKGLSTIAGSWIGGGANQTAMKEIFLVEDNLFATMIVVDVVVANVWMGFLLYGAGRYREIDRWMKADNSAIEKLREKVERFQSSVAKIPTTSEWFLLLAVAFGGTAISHWGADVIVPWTKQYAEQLQAYRLDAIISTFFWVVVIATSLGLVLSFSKAKNLEGVGASKLGSVFIYILVATIGMKMDLGQVWQNIGLFAVGIVWMLIHIIVLLLVGRLIRAPFFFIAVGSQANIGGAASAPVVASAFSPALAPVGVLLAVLGYALGTYGGLVCAYLMSLIV